MGSINKPVQRFQNVLFKLGSVRNLSPPSPLDSETVRSNSNLVSPANASNGGNALPLDSPTRSEAPYNLSPSSMPIEHSDDEQLLQHPTPRGKEPKFPITTMLLGITTTLGSAGCFVGQHLATGALGDWLLVGGIVLAALSIAMWFVFVHKCSKGQFCS